MGSSTAIPRSTTTGSGTSASASDTRSTPRANPSSAVGDSVYLFGGLRFGGEYTGTFSRAIQRVDLASGRATIVGRLPTSYAHAMAMVRDGQVFVLGGSTPAGASSAILRFDPATGAVSRAGTLPERVAGGGVATIGDTTYVIGGISAGPLTSVCIVRIG